MAKNKEYTNIFAKMLQHHNYTIVPILRKLNLRTVKVRNTKIMRLQEILETEDKVVLAVDVFAEYLVTHHIILPFLNQNQLNTAYALIRTADKGNVLIGINCIYNLIEEYKTSCNKT